MTKGRALKADVSGTSNLGIAGALKPPKGDGASVGSALFIALTSAWGRVNSGGLPSWVPHRLGLGLGLGLGASVSSPWAVAAALTLTLTLTRALTLTLTRTRTLTRPSVVPQRLRAAGLASWAWSVT